MGTNEQILQYNRCHILEAANLLYLPLLIADPHHSPIEVTSVIPLLIANHHYTSH